MVSESIRERMKELDFEIKIYGEIVDELGVTDDYGEKKMENQEREPYVPYERAISLLYDKTVPECREAEEYLTTQGIAVLKIPCSGLIEPKLLVGPRGISFQGIDRIKSITREGIERLLIEEKAAMLRKKRD